MTAEEVHKLYTDLGFQLLELGEDKKPKKRRKLARGGCSKHSVKLHQHNKDMYFAIVPPNNIMIIDVDIKNGKQGFESLEKLEDDLMCDLKPNVITGSGGYHIYVEIDRPYKIEQKDYPDIDFICYKPNKDICTPYAVAGGQEISFEGKIYKYELLSNTILKVDGLQDILEENVYEVNLDDSMINSNDIFERKSSEQVRLLMNWINAGDYHEWVANCGAIKNELGNTEEAFEIFHSWSKTDESYSSREDCLVKWKSIDKNHSNPRTMGTVYMQATQSKLDTFIKGLNDLDPSDLDELDEYLSDSKWTEYPLFSGKVVHNNISKALANHYDELNTNTARQLLKPYKLAGKDEINETVMAEIVDDENPFVDYVKSLAFTRNNIYDLRTGARWDEPTLEIKHSRDLVKLQNRLGLKKAFTLKQAFKQNMIPIVSFNEYNPSTNERVFVNDRGAKVLNLFDPTTLPSASIPTEEGSKLIRKFVKHLEILTNKEEAKTLLDWMAYITQNPGKKVLWVPMIQSVEGVGKSLIGNLLINHVFGPANAGIVDSVIIADKNNSWASSKMLRVLEEIKLSGHNRYEVLNQLKPLITNPTITRVEKFEVSSEVRNTCNFIAFTNYKDALPVDDTDRRWWIVFSQIDDLHHLERVIGVSLYDYFSPLHKLAKPDSPYGPEFKTFLLDRDLSEFNPNFPPESKHKEELAEIERSKIDGMEELYALLIHLYGKDYPNNEYPKLVDVREIKIASELAVDDNGARLSKDMRIKDIKFILRKMKYKQLTKDNVIDPDWSGISPLMYHRPTTTLAQASSLFKSKAQKDVIAEEFDEL